MTFLPASLRRGLVVLSLFVAHTATATADETTYTLGVGEFDATLIQGRETSIYVTLDGSTPTGSKKECIDDFAGEGWGCGGKPCDDWRTVPNPPITTHASATLVSATCGDGTACDLAIEAPGRVRITAAKVGAFVLHLVATNNIRRDITITVTDNSLRFAHVPLHSAQSPKNVFLVGQTWQWCAIPPTRTEPVKAIFKTEGPIEHVDSPYDTCTTLRATATGTGHVTATTIDDRTVTVDVDVVDPEAATEIEFLSNHQWIYRTDNAVDDTLAIGKAIRSDPYVDATDVCIGEDALSGRFRIADGRYGLLPPEAIIVTANQDIAMLGTQRIEIPRPIVARCPF